MEQSTIVKLKDNYLFFQEGDLMCVYNTEESLVKLKFGCKELIDTYALKRELAKPHTLHWLSSQSYWSWLGVLYNRYPELFEVLDARTLKQERSKNELSEIIARGSYAEKVDVRMDFSESTLVLYGLTKTNVMIAEAVSDMNYKSMIFIDRGEVVEAEDVLDERGIFAFEDLLKSKKEAMSEYYYNKKESVSFIHREDLGKLADVEKCIYLVENNGIEKEELLEVNRYITKYKKVAIFFQMQQEELIFGPLVVGGESTCLECLDHNGMFEKYYGSKSVPIDSVFRYMLMFFIKRTLCYVKDNDLYILLGDVQIPLNKVFTINRLTMRGEFDYIYRDIECECAIA